MILKSLESLQEFANKVIRWLIARGYMPEAIADYYIKLYLSEEIEIDLEHANQLIEDQLKVLKAKIEQL